MHAVMLSLLLSQAGSEPSAAPRADSVILAEAEAAFRAGTAETDPPKALQHFKKSAQLYGELAAHGSRNAELYRNLGNASMLHGDLAGAILAYRLGLELAPDDPILQENLDVARGQVAFPQPGTFARPPVEHWPPWLPRPGIHGLFVVLLVLYVLALFAWLRWRITQQDPLLAIALTAALLAVGVAGLTFFQVQAHTERASQRLVVIADNDLLLRRGDGPDYPASYATPLNRGVEAVLLFDGGAWLQIQLSGGEVGWIPTESARVESRAG